MYYTATKTTTHTVVDIRKTFEGFESDLRMIARRTDKWSMSYVDKVFYDVIKLAEAKYLSSVSIVLLDSKGNPIKATKFIVNSDGSSITGERAGGNDWSNLPNTTLSVILSYTKSWGNLTADQQGKFRTNNGFQLSWVNTQINLAFPHLSKTNGQLYVSSGYELQKLNYK
jgi:hypothetical protein